MNELIAALTKAGAPLLGTLIGGPVGTLAGAAIGALAEALGTPATPEAIKAAIEQKPGADAIVRKVEAEQAPAMLESYLKDVQDARAQTLALASQGSSIAWGAPVVSIIVTLGFFTVMGMLFVVRVDLPPASANLLNVLFGALIPAFGQVVNYWLGSSAGSARNSDTLRSIAQNASAPTAGQIVGKALDAAVKTAVRK